MIVDLCVAAIREDLNKKTLKAIRQVMSELKQKRRLSAAFSSSAIWINYEFPPSSRPAVFGASDAFLAPLSLLKRGRDRLRADGGRSDAGSTKEPVAHALDIGSFDEFAAGAM